MDCAEIVVLDNEVDEIRCVDVGKELNEWAVQRRPAQVARKAFDLELDEVRKED